MYIIGIGGSVIIDSNRRLKSDVITEYTEILNEESESLLGVVVGGGDTAREYIRAAGELEISDEMQDELGIDITRANARLMSIPPSFDTKYVRSLDDALRSKTSGKVPFIGGTEAGQTTDAVATQLGAVLDADRVLLASNVDGIYDTRGGVDISNARRFDRINIKELRQIASDLGTEPGRSIPVDRSAIDCIEENSMSAILFDGTDPDNFRRATEGDDSVGTLIET